MTDLLKKAQALDEANGLTDEARAAQAKQVKDYRRRVAKLNAWMYRDESNTPTEADFDALAKAEHAYRSLGY